MVSRLLATELPHGIRHRKRFGNRYFTFGPVGDHYCLKPLRQKSDSRSVKATRAYLDPELTFRY